MVAVSDANTHDMNALRLRSTPFRPCVPVADHGAAARPSLHADKGYDYDELRL